MKTRPILFNAEMVRAILDGRKTQTRRVVKPSKSRLPYHQLMDHDPETGIWGLAWGGAAHGGFVDGCDDLRCPYGAPGDRLWVRETWRFLGTDMLKLGRTHPRQIGVFEYKATPQKYAPRIERPWQDIEQYMVTKHGKRWRSPLHMYRWLSRITLEVLSVRVERVQDITEGDARDEGAAALSPAPYCSVRDDFEWLWDTINAKRGYGWEANPWVWVVGFKVVG